MLLNCHDSLLKALGNIFLNKYDEIIYMENGSIKENGSFEELINTGSHFSEYFRLKE